jgi:hypothetical protein
MSLVDEFLETEDASDGRLRLPVPSRWLVFLSVLLAGDL